MQQSLNLIDGKERSCNVIIAGVPEDDITVPQTNSATTNDNITLSNDTEKIRHLVSLLKSTYFTEEEINNFHLVRIGKTRAGVNRAIKLTLESSSDRMLFLKNTANLKDANEPWKKVFIKKDLHPVYVKENNRVCVETRPCKR